jgi:hypothetical protein
MNVPKSLARVLLDENAINLVSRITPHRTEISSYPLCCSSRILPTPWLYSVQRNKAPRDLVHPSVTTPTQSIILPGTPQRTSQMPRSKKGMRTFRLDSASPLDVKSALESRLPPTVQRIHQFGTSERQNHASAITSEDQVSTMVHPLEPSLSETPAIATEDNRASRVEEKQTADREESVIREA